jgi:hypothetical protein
VPSFDFVSKVNSMEIENAVNQSKPELANRFDLEDAFLSSFAICPSSALAVVAQWISAICSLLSALPSPPRPAFSATFFVMSVRVGARPFLSVRVNDARPGRAATHREKPVLQRRHDDQRFTA